MTQRQQRIGAMEAALARWQPNSLSEQEEREIIDKIVRHCACIGEGPLTWLMGQSRPNTSTALLIKTEENKELLACPRCGERRFKTPKAVDGHMRVCKKGGTEK
ncbi:hypothetical protein [Runella sp.]|uniref:hypothetical protein n=1 Tax=Runella sp. TaxID=1960881 RepID=UPI003D0D72FF